MKMLRLVALIGGVALLVAAGSPAQEKKTSGPTIKTREVARDKYDQMRDAPTARGVSGDETLRHGDLLVIRRAGQGTINGVLVYQDTKNDRLMVRTRPNTVPVAIPMKDVEEIERIVPAAIQGKEPGGVRFATEAEARRGGNAEIQSLEVYNGPVRTVHYFGDTLSPAERAELDALERAANKQASDAYLVQTLSNRLERGPDRPDLTALLNREPPAPPAFATSTVTNVYPVAPPIVPYNTPFYPAGPAFTAAAPALAALPAIINEARTPAPTVIEMPSQDSESPVEMVKALRGAQDALAKSRQEYATVSTRAVRDSDGRIVAVRLEEK